MKTRTTFILSLTAILTLAAGSAFGKYSGGTGEPNTPYQIATKADLLVLAADANDYGKCFILTADIDMEGQVFTTAIIAPDTSSSSGFQGTAFSGTFDGNDHKITHFTINGGSNDYLGLFGYISSGGSVKNLGLENYAVNGSSGSYWLGGLVGYNCGSISDCYSTGTVSGISVFGGLVGFSGGSISRCYSMGTVSGSGGTVGGLVGLNEYGSSINNCYSTGSVSGSGHVGGLVGDNSDSISNCYSTGTVSGTFYVGGLVGYNGGSISSSFWDTETSGCAGSFGGTGKTTAEMKRIGTFVNWDFIESWGIVENQTYPYLITGPTGDLNHDKKVDFKDFAIFADNWLSGE